MVSPCAPADRLPGGRREFIIRERKVIQMKRFCCLLVIAVMLLSIFPAAAETAETAAALHTVEKRNMPLVINGNSNYSILLYFLDGVEDLPYVELKEFTGRLNEWLSDSGTDFAWSEDAENGLCDITYQSNGSVLSFDFTDQSVGYSSFDTFGAQPGRFLLDMLSFSGRNSVTGEPELFRRLDASSLERKGSSQVIPLGDYAIPMVRQDGMYLLPLHTAVELAIDLPINRMGCYFNGNAVFFGDGSMFVETATDPQTGEQSQKLNKLGQSLFDCRFTKRSPQLAEYGFGELCMLLDYFYGLKTSHNISGFDWMLLDSGLYEKLVDEDPVVADAALRDLINFYLDDLHSAFQLVSPMTGFDTKLPEEKLGFSSTADQFHNMIFEEMRNLAFPDGVPFYQEVGNTAFISFDRFTVAPDLDYYSLNLDDPDSVKDTISLVLYANRRIRREGSPVKNVVLDLSLNAGGRADAAVFVAGWFLSKANITEINTFSGAQATGVYLVDTDLNRVFNGEDSLLGEYNLYCLTSPESFSAGNLLPWLFKTSGLVTLLGNTSGGGSCEVFPLTTAWGSSIVISGCKRLSFIKNGSFYDIDRGIEPDVIFTRIETFYNRQKIVEILSGLY